LVVSPFTPINDFLHPIILGKDYFTHFKNNVNYFFRNILSGMNSGFIIEIKKMYFENDIPK